MYLHVERETARATFETNIQNYNSRDRRKIGFLVRLRCRPAGVSPSLRPTDGLAGAYILCRLFMYA